MEINGRTGFFCLIGSPVGHSGSPAMYNYSFQKTEQDYVYLAFDVDLDKTEEAVSALKALGCKGPGQLLSHMCTGLKKAVQVSIFHSQNPAVEQAVNVVRSALKRSRIISLPLKEGQQAAGYHCLPAAASRSRYHNSCHCISPSSSFGSCITATYTGFCAFGIW